MDYFTTLSYREKGGAYGAGALFHNGIFSLFSFRLAICDPLREKWDFRARIRNCVSSTARKRAT